MRSAECGMRNGGVRNAAIQKDGSLFLPLLIIFPREERERSFCKRWVGDRLERNAFQKRSSCGDDGGDSEPSPEDPSIMDSCAPEESGCHCADDFEGRDRFDSPG